MLLTMGKVIKPDFASLIWAAERLVEICYAASSKPEAASMAETLLLRLNAPIAFSHQNLGIRGKFLLSCMAPPPTPPTKR